VLHIGVECGVYGGTRTPHFLEWGIQYPHFSDTHGMVFEIFCAEWCIFSHF